jgi:ribonuclease P protein component
VREHGFFVTILSMLPKKNRLTRAQFDHYFKNGRRHHSEICTLIFHASPHFHTSVVVGKKVYKKAVDRNKLRRRVYALVRTYLLHKTSVCIVLVKPKVSSIPYTRAKEELITLLKKV